jgi:hypothetical protein
MRKERQYAIAGLVSLDCRGGGAAGVAGWLSRSRQPTVDVVYISWHHQQVF